MSFEKMLVSFQQLYFGYFLSNFDDFIEVIDLVDKLFYGIIESGKIH